MKKKYLILPALLAGTAMSSLQLSLPVLANDEPFIVSQSGVEQLQKQESALKNEVESARDNLAEAQEKLDQINAEMIGAFNEADGALGFYRYLVATDNTVDARKAVEVLEDTSGSTQNGNKKSIAGHTNLGKDGDATSLENLVKALDLIDECNQLRTSDSNFKNLNPLKVSSYLMAVSARQTNCSKDTLANSKAYLVEENLAWPRFLSPFQLWYTNEKADYDANHDASQAGHYLNIVNSEHKVTGAAISQNSCYGQVFDTDSSSYSDAMTTAEFRAKIDAYKNQKNNPTAVQNQEEKDKAQKALNDAEKALNEKEEALKNVQQQLINAGTSFNGNTDFEDFLKPGMSVLLGPGQSVNSFTNHTSMNTVVHCGENGQLNIDIAVGEVNGVPTLDELIAQSEKEDEVKPSPENPGDSQNSDTPGPTAPTPSKEQWKKIDGKWFCYRDSRKLIGKHTLKWEGTVGDYFFNDDGSLYHGWHKENGNWVYYTSSGEMKKNSWLNVDNHWFYASKTGVMAKGWIQDKDLWYYMMPVSIQKVPECGMFTGWLKDGSHLFYMDASGKSVTGWKTLNGYSYYFYPENSEKGPRGSLAIDTFIDGYYVDENGAWIK